MKPALAVLALAPALLVGQSDIGKGTASSNGLVWSSGSSSFANYYQRCDSITAANSGGWKPAASAPRDGSTVEMMQTYGIAPWYGLFKWMKEDSKYNPDGGRWQDVEDEHKGVAESSCLFWRPTKQTAGHYHDPTNGRQFTVKYWCDASHLGYDSKKDACK